MGGGEAQAEPTGLFFNVRHWTGWGGKVSGRRIGERGCGRCELSIVRLQEKEKEATQRLGHVRRKELCHAELEVVKFLEKGHNPQVQASSTTS